MLDFVTFFEKFIGTEMAVFAFCQPFLRCFLHICLCFFQCVCTSVRLRLAGTCILIVNLLVSLVTDNKLHHYPFFYKLSKNFFKVCLLSTIFCDAFCISVSIFSVCTYQCQTSTGLYLHTDCKFARPVSH